MKNVLIIEPDEVLAGIYKEFLVKNGFKVKHSKTAQDAITKADQETPDLVLLELQLIGHSGVEFLYEFRSYSEWQDIPVVICSQVPKREFNNNKKILEQELGIMDYLYKPTTSLKHLLLVVKTNTLQNA